MRPHDVSGACGHAPSTAPSPTAGVRASGQRAATPAAIGSRPARGTVRHPLGGLFLGPVSRAGTAVEVPASAESSEGAGPENSSATPLGGLFFNPGFASRRRGRHACRGKLWTVGPGNGSPPPSAGCSFRLGLDVDSPPAVLRFSRTDQVPDSVTDIDRPAAGADPPRGHDAAPARRFEQWRVQYSGSGEFGTPSCNAAGRDR